VKKVNRYRLVGTEGSWINMEDLSFLTIRLMCAFPSVREFRIPIHPDLHTNCGANFVSVVDDLSRHLIREGMIARGDIRFEYEFDTGVLIVIIPNRRLFPCGLEDDDPDQFNCYFGIPMRPYRTMSEGIAVNPFLSLTLLHVLYTQTAPKLHVSNLHPEIGAILDTYSWPGSRRWVQRKDAGEDWWMLQD
jgi:hypothetical protein